MYFFQPINGSFGEVLCTEMEKEESKRYNNFEMLVAYARHSGVARIAGHLEKLIRGGAEAKAMVGIDQGQTSKEALQLLLKIGVSVSVFYDEDLNRTFHPKVYRLQGESGAQWIAVGSNNLTGGGLYLNYEVAVIDDADSNTERGKENSAFFDRIRTEYRESALLRTLDADLLNELEADGYLFREAVIRAKRASSAATSKRTGAGTTEKKPLFERSDRPELPAIDARFKLEKDPRPSALDEIVEPMEEGEEEAAAAEKQTPQDDTEVALPGPASPNFGFWKMLSNWDVSQKSSPGQIVIPIQFLNFFPELDNYTETEKNAIQADHKLEVEFIDEIDAANSQNADDARIILYMPADDHKRRNEELRFTFRVRKILEVLNAGDILEFHPTGRAKPDMIVTRRAPSQQNQGKQRYGQLT